jgi:hypothetical protein
MLQKFDIERSIASSTLTQLIQEEVCGFLEKSYRTIDSKWKSWIRGKLSAIQLRSTKATLFEYEART